MLSKLLAALALAGATVAGPTSTHAAGAAAVDAAGYVFQAGRYRKAARLATLHAADLVHASRTQNVDGLLALAQAENRLDAVDALQLAARYNRVAEGDLLLLTCLRKKDCNPETFFSITQTSKLHAEVIRRRPELNPSQATQEVGALSERVMNRYFESSGWMRVEGQVGRNGFDGLYVKREGGVVKDVLFAESKYNSSLLDTTKNCGMQMSQTWTVCKLVELKQRYPDRPIYDDIQRYVDSGSYRGVLWNMKLDDNALYVKVSKLHSKGGDVFIADAAGSDVADLWTHPTNAFSLKSPNTGFDKEMVRWYRAELDAVGPAPAL